MNDPTVGSAVLSPDGIYRYSLHRDWRSPTLVRSSRWVTFVMLNPSVADADTDDPTIRRCVGFAKAMGGTGLVVVNLYAYRATRPADLWAARDPVGPDNNHYLATALALATEHDSPVVAAWGAHAPAARVADVMAMPGAVRVTCLGATQGGAMRAPPPPALPAHNRPPHGVATRKRPPAMNSPPHYPPATAPQRAWWLRLLPTVSLIAVVTLTSTSEWHLARTVLDLPPAVAWSVPVAIDAYVIAAFRSGRDIGPAIAVMAGALAAATGSHLAAQQYPGGVLPVTITAPTAAVIMAVLVAVAWRVHVLIDHPPGAPVGAATPPPVTPDHSEATPVLATPPDPVTGSPAAHAVVGDGWSDAAILADASGTAPGVREVMRRYRVGQRRATRLANVLANANVKETATHQHQTDKPVTNTHSAIPAIQSTQESQHTQQTPPQETPEINHDKNPKKSHPGITDREGPHKPHAHKPESEYEPFIGGRVNS
jgi:hypothetical protein